MDKKSKEYNFDQLKFMDESEAKKLLTLFNIPLQKETVIRYTDEAEKAAEFKGFPLVIKVLDVANKN